MRQHYVPSLVSGPVLENNWPDFWVSVLRVEPAVVGMVPMRYYDFSKQNGPIIQHRTPSSHRSSDGGTFDVSACHPAHDTRYPPKRRPFPFEEKKFGHPAEDAKCERKCQVTSL